jgi:hypothetical protein
MAFAGPEAYQNMGHEGLLDAAPSENAEGDLAADKRNKEIDPPLRCAGDTLR